MKQQSAAKCWFCPFCNVLIPIFRPYPDMWKKRIENHLLKNHLDDLNDKDWRDFLRQEKVVKR